MELLITTGIISRIQYTRASLCIEILQKYTQNLECNFCKFCSQIFSCVKKEFCDELMESYLQHKVSLSLWCINQTYDHFYYLAFLKQLSLLSSPRHPILEKDQTNERILNGVPQIGLTKRHIYVS